MTTKTRRNQVTCECTAYNFPHRIGGGKCSGAAWCDSYRNVDTNLCDMCNCFNDGECEVAVGLESFIYGECYAEELHAHSVKDEYGNLPMSLDDIFKIKEERRIYNDYEEQ